VVVEEEDETALGGMAQDGEAQVTAVIVAMMIGAEAEVVEEEAAEDVDIVKILLRITALEL
jgi:hypothetical protein